MSPLRLPQTTWTGEVSQNGSATPQQFCWLLAGSLALFPCGELAVFLDPNVFPVLTFSLLADPNTGLLGHTPLDFVSWALP